MNSSEELLQRCFDNDLGDNEMKALFTELSTSVQLRYEFRSFQSMRTGLNAADNPSIPLSLDTRMESLFSSTLFRVSSLVLLNAVVSKRFTVSIAAIAATLVLVLFGSYIAAINTIPSSTTTEYVYVSELPAYVVQSSFHEIKNN
ncbi:MAG: hypothetical protein WCX28_13990 [Bacteriovoracaceae bacterium]|nr:hypothetical protein [Bacteroidota bacterium]